MATIKTVRTSLPRRFTEYVLSLPLWWFNAAKYAVLDDVGTDYATVAAFTLVITAVLVLFMPGVILFFGWMNWWQVLLMALLIYLIMGAIYRVFQRS